MASLYTFRYSNTVHNIIPEKDNLALREIAKNVPISDIKSARIRALISDMKKLLSVEKYGVALAAPQVGESLRLFIISGRALTIGKRTAPDSAKASSGKPDVREIEATPPPAGEKSPQLPDPSASARGRDGSRPERSEADQVYINPELLKISRQKSEKHEGCLSVRGKWGIVPRAEKATLRAYDENGIRFTRGASGFLAHIFQHELDHLEGILYTDKAAELYDEKEEHPPAG